MKLKFVLVLLVVLGFAIVGCSNDSVKNDSVKNDSVKNDSVKNDSVKNDSVKNEIKKEESKWFSPTNKKVSWEKADKVCRDNGGRLPTIDELKKVVTDCGGTVAEDLGKIADKNTENKEYQSCYERKGFHSSFSWSSTSFVGYENGAWIVLFYYGNVRGSSKDANVYVRCVRDGQ